jgi:hypothetical protein
LSESNLFLIVVLIDDVKPFKELVDVSIASILLLILVVKLFKLPVLVSKALSLPFCVDSTVLLDDVKLLKSLLILLLALSKDVNLPFALEVKLFKLPVEVSMDDNLSDALDVNVFKLPVEVSMDDNLSDALDVNVFKLPVEVSMDDNLSDALDVNVFKLLVVT